LHAPVCPFHHTDEERLKPRNAPPPGMNPGGFRGLKSQFDDACAKSMTVRDEAAGRTGKCPACGTTLVVPRTAPEPEEFALLEEPAPVAGPAPSPSRSGSPMPTTAPRPAGSVGHGSGVADHGDELVPVSGGGRVRFGAIGLGWDLLKAKLGTWVLAALVFAPGATGRTRPVPGCRGRDGTGFVSAGSASDGRRTGPILQL
jgi:hypothetical protein